MMYIFKCQNFQEPPPPPPTPRDLVNTFEKVALRHWNKPNLHVLLYNKNLYYDKNRLHIALENYRNVHRRCASSQHALHDMQ
jgi:hypothetical protein